MEKLTAFARPSLLIAQLQNLRVRFPIGLPVLASLTAFLWACAGTGESFWLDELHTSWVLADGWESIPDRAAAGNQSPWYFTLLAAFKATVGMLRGSSGVNDELLLRLPSMLTWSLAIGLAAWAYRRSRCPSGVPSSVPRGKNAAGDSGCNDSAAIVWGLCAWIAIDRLQWFYAVEARAYSLVQLLSLLGWLVVARLVTIRHGNTGKAPWWLCWTVLATAMMSLHMTSATAVFAQWLMLSLFVFRRSGNRFAWMAISLWLAALGYFLLNENQSVWQHRQQWAAFAGDSSWRSVIRQFPILVAVAVVGAVLLVTTWRTANCSGARLYVAAHRLKRPMKARRVSEEWRHLSSLTRRASDKIHVQPVNGYRFNEWSEVGFWAWASLLPLIAAWAAAHFQIAPIFHYRFVITAAIPLYLLLGALVVKLPTRSLRWLAVIGTLIWLVSFQGTIHSWKRGQWMGPIRGEDWRQATEFVSQRIDPERESLWCYAGLLEGHNVQVPLSSEQDEYLSYPLRGCYRVHSEGMIVQPHALVGSSRDWAEQLGQRENDQTQGVWIVCRGSRENLEKRLKLAGLYSLPQICPIEAFGRVSVVCLQVSIE